MAYIQDKQEKWNHNSTPHQLWTKVLEETINEMNKNNWIHQRTFSWGLSYDHDREQDNGTRNTQVCLMVKCNKW